MRLLANLNQDAEVIGPSCLPITVVPQVNGHVLIAELVAPFRETVVAPETKLAAFRVGDAVWVVPEDMVPPDPDLYGKTIDACKSRFPASSFTGEPRIPEDPKFTNKINFGSGMRGLDAPDVEDGFRRFMESVAGRAGFRFKDHTDYTPEDRSVFGDTPCKLPVDGPAAREWESPAFSRFKRITPTPAFERLDGKAFEVVDSGFPDVDPILRLIPGIHPPESLLNEDGCMVVGAKPEADTKIVISIYIDNGNVFEYDVKTPSSAREHVSAIIATGYRHSDPTAPDELVHFPPHRISKVKMRGPGITTKYYDRSTGT